MAIHEETDIYRATSEFNLFVGARVVHLPRHVKDIYGRLLVQEALCMQVAVRHANIARGADKVPHFEQLLDLVESSRSILRTLWHHKWLSHTAWGESLPLIVSIGKQATALRNHFAPEPAPAA